MVRSNLLKGVIVVSIAVVCFLPLYSTLYLNPSVTNILMKYTEEQAILDTSHMASTLFTENGKINYDSITPSFKEEINKLEDDFKLIKIKVFSPIGEIVYSSDPRDIGTINEKPYFHEIVAKGLNHTKIVSKDSKTLEGQIMPVDVVETYVPIMRGDRFIGAFEIYYDITARKEKLEGLISRSTSIVFIVTFCLLIAVILSSVKANRSIAKHNHAEEELRNHHDHLEDLVRERAAEIIRTNKMLKREINDHKATLEALKESERKYRDLFENAIDPIFVVDSGLNYIDVNRKATEAFGYSREEFLKMNILDLIPPEHISESDSAFEKLKTEGSFENFVSKMRTKDGTWLDIEISSSAIIKNGKIAGSRDIVRDITQRVRMEQELAKNANLESLGMLAGGLAHDFNNLLFVIMGNTSLVERLSRRGENVAPILDNIENAVFEASDLTKRLLTFSKGGAPVRKTSSIKRLITDTASFALSGSTISCEYDITDDLWTVKIDEGQISQAIHNLVMNAREATPEGKIITIRAVNTSLRNAEVPPLKEGNYIRISIEDNGAGIPAENLSKIFDPYFSTKDAGNKKGMGLGLALCHSIIKRHHGSIDVESVAGQGTSFYIYIPASDHASDKSAPAEISDGINISLSSKILIMDDDQAIRETACKMLEAIGYEAEAAADGAEATVLFKKAKDSGQPFDAVILDLTVAGGMGGKETVKELQKIDPDVNAIVSSGYSNDAVMTDYRKYGFTSAIAKPYNIIELNKIILRSTIDNS